MKTTAFALFRKEMRIDFVNPYTRGFNAYKNNQTNPYDFINQPVEWEEWTDGWLTAMEKNNNN